MELGLKVIAERVLKEIAVRDQQGYDVTGLAEAWELLKDSRPGLVELHQRLNQLPMQSGWPYHEPSDLEGIYQSSPAEIVLPDFYLSEEEILNKIHGGWLGRTAGCILGKPLEIGLSRDEIREYLEGANAYPLNDYVPAQSRKGKFLRRDCVPSMQGYLRYVQEDDDLNYMCLAVKLLERHGFNFTTLDVGLNWLGSVPFFWTWGPEHAIYLNLAIAVGEHPETVSPKGIDLDEVKGYFNPGTEWLGAQIRTDVYGYVCPHQPGLAAQLAWRDANLTHRSSGIYGAMWVSAMNAAAFSLMDMETIIRAGLAQVPKNSRFSEAIQKTIEWCKNDNDWIRTGQRIVDQFGRYGFAGTINNACCVTAALLYGWGDGSSSPADIYQRTITTAVQLGYDTDCNGATAGSVIGVVIGANRLPEKWVKPLNDTLRTCVAEFGQVKISEMARRCYELSRINRGSGSLSRSTQLNSIS